MNKCVINECNDSSKISGMCRKHYNAEYFKKNKESILKLHKLYYQNNKEKMQKWRRDYHKAHPEVSRRNKNIRKYKSKIKQEKYTDRKVLDTYGSICYLCNKEINLKAPRRTGIKGWEKGLHIEHVIDIAKGGPDTLANVRPSHALCNLTKKPVGMV